MTKRERITAAIRHQPTDIIPYQTDLTQDECDKVCRATGKKDWAELYDYMDNHMISCGDFRSEPTGKAGHFRDPYGVVWDKTHDRDIGVVAEYLVPDLDRITFVPPKPDERVIRDSIEYALKVGGEKKQFTFFNVSFSLFERAWTLVGMENLLVGFIESPDAVHDLMRRITDYNLAAVGIATEYKELDAVMFGDDWGQQRSLIMGREHWVTFIKPYLKEMYGAAKRAGKLVLQHSCGNIESVFDDVIELGLDAYQTFQPEIYDIEKVKARYGGRLSFWGGISTQQLLPTATPEFLRSEIIRIMRIMGKGGGYIAAPTHSVPRDVPAENILTMIDVFKNQKANGI